MHRPILYYFNRHSLDNSGSACAFLPAKVVRQERYDLASIKKYIQEQAHRDVSSYTSSAFVLTEPGDMVIRGYYSLLSLSIVFNKLPEKVQKRLPRYPETSGILPDRNKLSML
jgi:hypothetical protein